MAKEPAQAQSPMRTSSRFSGSSESNPYVDGARTDSTFAV